MIFTTGNFHASPTLTSQKTVFVLGAGASAEFDLPIGNGLKTQIRNLLGYKFRDYSRTSGDELILQSLSYRAQSLRLASQEADGYVRAARDIAEAMPIATSIDNYLHSHNGDEAIELCGKLAIVRAILSAEGASKLRQADRHIRIDLPRVENTWIAALMRVIGENCTVDTIRSRLSQMAFIVFNYDRCLEHFMYHAFQAYFRISAQAAAELVKSMEIYHPYGKVGELPFDSNHNEPEVSEFGEQPTIKKLLDLAGGIKTFTEGMDDSSREAIAMRKCFASASRLVFLGFAFHPLNMALMQGGIPDNTPLYRAVYATVYGTSGPDVTQIELDLRNQLSADGVYLCNKTSADLFFEYSRSLRFI